MPNTTARVLVVDDDKAMLRTATEVVSGLGYTAIPAINGADALRILRRDHDISILFSDINMPGITGDRLAKFALAMRPDLHVVLTSGAHPVDCHLPFIQKPYRARDLSAAFPEPQDSLQAKA